MKKILVVFSNISYSQSLADFSLALARETQGFLHAVFVNPLVFSSRQYPFPSDISMAYTRLDAEEEEQGERKLTEAHAQLFRESGERAGIPFKIDAGPEIAVEDLINQSAYADLVLTEAKTRIDEVYVRELLADTHCPVVLVPENAAVPQRAVFCYDESYSSMLAIKMFSYLFPEWKQLSGHVVSVNPKGDNGLQYADYLGDWLPLHFPNIKPLVLEGNLQRELVSFIRKGDEPAVVVMGAYGRNAVSRLFHRSLAHVVVEDTDALVFIMHE